MIHIEWIYAVTESKLNGSNSNPTELNLKRQIWAKSNGAEQNKNWNLIEPYQADLSRAEQNQPKLKKNRADGAPSQTEPKLNIAD